MPPSSAGCDLPAMTSWIGRSGCEQQPLEPLGVAQHQRQPLVRRHAAGEADGQHVGVERACRSSRARPGARRACCHDSRSRRAGVLDQPLAQLAAWSPRCRAPGSCRRRPRTLGVVGRRRRRRWLAASSKTSRATQVGACTPLVIERDRHLGLVEGGPQPVEHPAADVAVQLGDAVGALGEPEAHHRHVEDAGSPPVVVLGAEREDPLDGHAGRRRCRRRSTARSARAGSGRCRPGTGVCVVNTVPARATSSAVSKSSSGRPRRR